MHRTSPDTAAVRAARFDPLRARADFPILAELVRHKPLVYLDNANTTQKPGMVLEALDAFYRHTNANIHRATHQLGELATAAYEGARTKIARFLHAQNGAEIVLTKGCTDGINLVAQSFARPRLRPGDEILVSWMEHHSNIVPWQLVCAQTGARLRAVPIDDEGELRLDEFDRLLTEKTRLVAIIHVSNTLGTIVPVRAIVDRAHAYGVPVLVDGAQSVGHLPVDVQALDCDFFAFSSHKMYGPTGSGALYGKRAWLEEMPPYQGGGDMIASVTFERTTYNAVPYKFEAGTPNIAGAVGAGAAVDYLSQFDMASVAAHEDDLLTYATARMLEIPGLRILGEARDKTGVLSFLLDGIHAHDIGTILDREGVAIRTGQHCAQPVMDRFGVPATARASFALYNTRDDVDRLIDAVVRAREIFDGSGKGPSVYQDVILDHNRRPRSCHVMKDPTAVSEGENRACGDRVTVFLRLDGDRIADVSFDGPLCAIAKASASLMTECVRGRHIRYVDTLADSLSMVLQGVAASTLPDQVGGLKVFSTFRDYPSRLTCVMLGWEALQNALQSAAAARPHST
jgi:cysteine desulfurase/selenocysteine lyase